MEKGFEMMMVEALARIEGKQDAILKLLGGRVPASFDGEGMRKVNAMTTKQHAAAQMVIAGQSNADIAKVLNVTENTAKVHVRLLAKKLGVRTRAEIVAKLQPIFNAMDEEQYLLASGGLPKDWYENFETDPQYEVVRG